MSVADPNAKDLCQDRLRFGYEEAYTRTWSGLPGCTNKVAQCGPRIGRERNISQGGYVLANLVLLQGTVGSLTISAAEAGPSTVHKPSRGVDSLTVVRDEDR